MAGRGFALLVAVGCALEAWTAQAAEFNFRPGDNGKRPFILVSGELAPGDEKRFENVALQFDSGAAVVAFNSPGGNLIAGLGIGRTIRYRQFDTTVLPTNYCASACALAWLAGTEKYYFSEGLVGFHAAFDMTDQKPSPGGNAVVGAYLHSLNLSDEAVFELTNTPPDKMRWLDPKEAARLGISLNVVSLPAQSDREATNKVGPAAPMPAPAPTSPQHTPTPVPVPDANFLDPDARSGAPEKAPEAAAVPDANFLDPDVHSIPHQAALPPLGSPIELSPKRPTPTTVPRVPEADRLEPQLLRLELLEAASQVQQRLKERGYFSGLIDGVWGPRSRLALRDFQRANGLGLDDAWDRRVQSALFDDRFRIASADYSPPDPAVMTDGLYMPFSPPAGAKLHPLNPQDALIVQGRLFELGYYRKPGDGIWGLASHSALRDFKVAQKLPVDDSWGAAVEEVLMSGQALPASGTPFGEWTALGSSCADPSDTRRLVISAETIVAGQRICRLDPPLSRNESDWGGVAMCSIAGRDVPARLSLKLVSGRLADYSALGNQPQQNPTLFERCH